LQHFDHAHASFRKTGRSMFVYEPAFILQTQINKYGIFKTLHPDVEEAFVLYEWPGNARELENMIERLFRAYDSLIHRFHS
jgi:transcriptional regulator with PAS, ATPase and Fis domain